MRLIDADLIVKRLEEQYKSCSNLACECNSMNYKKQYDGFMETREHAEWELKFIKRIPTAYDVEKVIEELKEKSFFDEQEIYGDNGVLFIGLFEAIDIVGKGGVE